MNMHSRPGTRSRLRRLERLERLEQSRQSERPSTGTEFYIDPTLARTILEDYQRLRCNFSGHPKPLPGEVEEAAARLAASLRGVRCPDDYWAKQADTDRRLLNDLGFKTTLSEAEELQLKARMIVFDSSPDGAAWRRMFQLTYRKRNAAENAEFDELNRRYPGMPLEVYDSLVVMVAKLEEQRRDAGHVVDEDPENQTVETRATLDGYRRRCFRAVVSANHRDRGDPPIDHVAKRSHREISQREQGSGANERRILAAGAAADLHGVEIKRGRS
jgi:hypothetical protein